MFRWLAIATAGVLYAWLPGCGKSLGGEGSACTRDMDCRGVLLCVDGICRPHDFDDCLPDGCADGFVCDNGICVEAGCLAVECLDNESCVGGACYPRDCQTRTCPGLGEVCVEEECVPGSCLDVECPPGQRCAKGLCYPIDCETQRCPGYGEVCIDGKCTQRSCVGVECPAGQQCANGYCYPAAVCGDDECRDGYVCEDGRCVERGCVSIQCPSGFLCADGMCWPENCPDVECVPGEVCQDGVCVAMPCVNGRCEPCDSNGDCEPGRVCVNGMCVPCIPESDAEFCDRLGVQCGPAAGEDSCAQPRDVAECGLCGADHFCSAGSCLPYSYSWQTGSWSSCSVSCGGGTQSRSVWCQRNDGVTVDDALCTADKPSSSRSCNTQPCCSTGSLQQYRDCTGNDLWMATHYGSDTGNASDRSSCASACTSQAVALSLSQWCCSLYEDSGAGTNWVCKVYEGSTAGGESDEYAANGQCQ